MKDLAGARVGIAIEGNEWLAIRPSLRLAGVDIFQFCAGETDNGIARIDYHSDTVLGIGIANETTLNFGRIQIPGEECQRDGASNHSLGASPGATTLKSDIFACFSGVAGSESLHYLQRGVRSLGFEIGPHNKGERCNGEDEEGFLDHMRVPILGMNL